MAVDPGSIDHLSQIISQVVGPSFLLGSVASFISMLYTRMHTVVERIRSLNGIPADDPDRAGLKADIPRLKRRTRLIHWSIVLAIASGVVTTLLIIIAFSMAFMHLEHVWGTALLFVVSLGFFAASLVVLAIDAANSVNEYDHY